MTPMIDLQIRAWAVALGLAQLALSVAFVVAGRGLLYGIGPRDELPRQLGVIASRLERAYKNYIESFRFFAAAVLLGHVANPGRPALLVVVADRGPIWSLQKKILTFFADRTA